MAAYASDPDPPWQLSSHCRIVLFLLALGISTIACDDFEYEGWINQPIPIRFENGVPLVEVSYRGAPQVLASIDTGSPLTAIHSASQIVALPKAGPLGDFNLIAGLGESRGELRLQDADHPDITRFIFRNFDVVDVPLHPIGLSNPMPLGGILGMTVLGHFAVHLSSSPPRLVLRRNVSDTSGELAADCRSAELLTPGGFAAERCIGVFRTPPTGGGTALLGDTAISLPASRLVVTLCAGPAPFDPTRSRTPLPTVTGTPLSAIIATGLGTSIISRSAFDRLHTRLPDLKETPRQTLYLQTGPLTVSTTEIPRVAIVDDRALDLGPCGELARRRRLVLAPNRGISPDDEGREGAAVALTVSPIVFAIVPDAAAILQGIRQELRSLVADVDVILGGSFLSAFSLDFDYPNGRTIFQCSLGLTAETCRVYPSCNQADGPPCPTRN